MRILILAVVASAMCLPGCGMPQAHYSTGYAFVEQVDNMKAGFDEVNTALYQYRQAALDAHFATAAASIEENPAHAKTALADLQLYVTKYAADTQVQAIREGRVASWAKTAYRLAGQWIRIAQEELVAPNQVRAALGLPTQQLQAAPRAAAAAPAK